MSPKLEIMEAAKEAGLYMTSPERIAAVERLVAIIEHKTIERCAQAAIEACTSDLTDDEVIAAIRKLGEQQCTKN